MKIYFSTFITGTQEVISKLLEKRKIEIILLLDGLVVYESDYLEREIRNFRFFNNTFILLYFFESLEPVIKSVEKILSVVANDKNLQSKIAINLPVRRKNFKIVSSLENQMVPVNRNLCKKIESIILQIRNLRLNIKKSDLEFWALVRRGGYGFFGIRITYPYRDENQRDKGELRSEIAYIMSVLSGVTPKDVILDPFAGHGAIPLERVQSFPYEKMIAIEKDKDLVTILRQKIKHKKKKIYIYQGDALNLSMVENNYVNRIITDPPWGIYKKTDIPLYEFYLKMLGEFLRVLRPRGVVVLLIGQTEIFEESLAKFSEYFNIDKSYQILVSGKKSTIYKLSI